MTITLIMISKSFNKYLGLELNCDVCCDNCMYCGLSYDYKLLPFRKLLPSRLLIRSLCHNIISLLPIVPKLFQPFSDLSESSSISSYVAFCHSSSFKINRLRLRLIPIQYIYKCKPHRINLIKLHWWAYILYMETNINNNRPQPHRVIGVIVVHL